MNILERIDFLAERNPQRPVMICGEKRLAWGELKQLSDRLAAWILDHDEGRKVPYAVYGHKDPWMLVCFLACVKAGHAYCPIDVTVPQERTAAILEALPGGVVLVPEAESEPPRAKGKTLLDREALRSILAEDRGEPLNFGDTCVRGGDIWYIIFTSGSTGVPKGVQISADNLNHYLDWSVTLGNSPEEKEGRVFLNQAPFSFDLSVMDLYTCLVCGGTLFCLTKQVQGSYSELLNRLGESGASVWVSTPSFAQMCLSDRKFCKALLPDLRVFLFCGETLANRTAVKLMQRFPEAVVINTYGPTESTVAVTDVKITPELAAGEEALPVGRAKPGTLLRIIDEQGAELPEGEKGEILILGDTVSPGYYRNPEMNAKAFFETQTADGSLCRAYHTGDAGWIKEGMLYYGGRIDLQIKLHGYRIELEDIENNLRRLPGVEHAVVLPNERGGTVSSLTGYVVLSEDATESPVLPEEAGNDQERSKEGSAARAEQIREDLKAWLPAYMIPKKLVFLKEMPVTANGKADRKRLKALVAKGAQ